MRRDSPEAVIRDLRGVPPELRRRLRPTVVNSARRVQRQAQRNAAPWSAQIPPSIGVSARFADKYPSARITLNRQRAPHGPLWERLKGFRAPLFGNRHKWYGHRGRPFLDPAMRKEGPTAARLIGRDLDQTTRRAGFR